jgi:hypothetical protein
MALGKKACQPRASWETAKLSSNIVDEAESLGEADESLMRSIGDRAESFASTQEFLFPDGFGNQTI